MLCTQAADRCIIECAGPACGGCRYCCVYKTTCELSRLCKALLDIEESLPEQSLNLDIADGEMP